MRVIFLSFAFLFIFNFPANSQCWKQIAAGENHAAAIKPDGTLWTWGYNAYGQLGDNANTNRTSPFQVSWENNWSDVAVGNYSAPIALKTDGTLWAAGDNSAGQFGDGT